MKYFNLSFFLVLFSLLITSCSDDDTMVEEPTPTNTIVDIASADDQFSTLVAAVQKAGLVETLQSEGTFTVFAPTNSAFSELLGILGASSLDDLTDDAVKDILLYHVLGQELASGDLSNTYVPTLAAIGPNGSAVDLLVSIDGGVSLNGNVNVTAADISADNGIVHVIDKVLLPPNVVDKAIANSTFTSLVSAVVRADLAGALSAEGPFTVFAPTNDAFAQLLVDLGVATIDDIPLDVLTKVLLYHVVSGNVLSTDLSNGMVPTLEGQMIDINIDGGVSINGDVNVVAADVQAVNGVIHVIDKVLLPQL